jgi:predicted alpha/beta-hydrolase family hydrolase
LFSCRSTVRLTPATSEPLTITVAEGLSVSAIFSTPVEASACYVLAHGAGAGMTHPFLEAVASELGDRGIATLRYNFPSWSGAQSALTRPHSLTRRSERP